eukprot:tig00021348_g20572.t1
MSPQPGPQAGAAPRLLPGPSPNAELAFSRAVMTKAELRRTNAEDVLLTDRRHRAKMLRGAEVTQFHVFPSSHTAEPARPPKHEVALDEPEPTPLRDPNEVPVLEAMAPRVRLALSKLPPPAALASRSAGAQEEAGPALSARDPFASPRDAYLERPLCAFQRVKYRNENHSISLGSWQRSPGDVQSHYRLQFPEGTGAGAGGAALAHEKVIRNGRVISKIESF